MKKISLAIVLFLATCSASAQHYSVSLMQVLLDSEKYIGKNVWVYGHLEDRAGLNLFLTEEHARAGDTASAVRVFDSTDDGGLTINCTSKAVYVKGTFFITPDGRLAIRDATQIMEVGKAKNCWSVK